MCAGWRREVGHSKLEGMRWRRRVPGPGEAVPIVWLWWWAVVRREVADLWYV